MPMIIQDISGGLTKEQQYGVGLMDLECAARRVTTVPIGSESTCRPAGSNSPPTPPTEFEEQSDSRETS